MIRASAIRLRFRYAAGVTASRFLRGLEAGRVLGSRCGTCGRVDCPASSFCSACGARTEVLEVGPGATLLSWTELPERGAYGLVRLDGADSAMLHRLVGPGPWTIGARVRARFAAKRTASVLAIEGFERGQEAER